MATEFDDLTSKLLSGFVVPIPTNPVFATTKLVPVDEPTANAGAVPFALVGLTDSCAQGVDVPTPTNPEFVNVVVAVPPKYAVYAEKIDDEAFVNPFKPLQ